MGIIGIKQWAISILQIFAYRSFFSTIKKDDIDAFVKAVIKNLDQYIFSSNILNRYQIILLGWGEIVSQEMLWQDIEVEYEIRMWQQHASRAVSATIKPPSPSSQDCISFSSHHKKMNDSLQIMNKKNRSGIRLGMGVYCIQRSLLTVQGIKYLC